MYIYIYIYIFVLTIWICICIGLRVRVRLGLTPIVFLFPLQVAAEQAEENGGGGAPEHRTNVLAALVLAGEYAQAAAYADQLPAQARVSLKKSSSPRCVYDETPTTSLRRVNNSK